MAFGAFAVKIVDGRIRSELRKLIDEKLTSAFLASLIPACPDPEAKDHMTVKAKLTVELAEIKIDFTVHAGGNTDGSTVLPAETHEIEIERDVPLRRPSDMTGSSALEIHDFELHLKTLLSGIEFKQELMGAGATVHSAAVSAVLRAEGTGTWKQI